MIIFKCFSIKILPIALATLALAACNFSTDHTVTIKDETGLTDKEVDLEVDVDIGESYVAITRIDEIEPAIEDDNAYFTNYERDRNWLWNYYDHALEPCHSSTLANMPFTEPHWYFATGCQFTSFSCNEIGWYEQVHNDFFLLEITNVGGHVDPKNCLGKGTYLCEFAVGKNSEKFEFHCEPTEEELGI